VRRFRLDQEGRLNIAILAIDPSRRKSGGALLGDRIRMNAIEGGRVFMRSLATRGAEAEISKSLPDVIAACKVAGFDLVLVETSGIGQGTPRSCRSRRFALFMTPEYGAASQLEKIDMLDFADSSPSISSTARGPGRAADVRKQYQRQPQALRPLLGGDAGIRHQSPRASTTMASPRSTRASYPRSSSTA